MEIIQFNIEHLKIRLISINAFHLLNLLKQLGKSPKLDAIQSYLDDNIIAEIKDTFANRTINGGSLEITQKSYV